MKNLLLICYVLLSSFTFIKTSEERTVNEPHYSVQGKPVNNELISALSLQTIDSVAPKLLMDNSDRVSSTVTPEPLIDNTTVQNILDVGYNIGVQAYGGKDFIPNVPNPLLHILVTALTFGIIRWLEKRKLRKKGLLIDKAPPQT